MGSITQMGPQGGDHNKKRRGTAAKKKNANPRVLQKQKERDRKERKTKKRQGLGKLKTMEIPGIDVI